METNALSFKQRFQLSRFVRGEAPVKGCIELTRRRVFILPTQRGLGMAFTIILLLLVAFIYNNNLTYFLAFLLASIFFVTILHTYLALAGLVIQTVTAEPVFVGELAKFTILVRNPSHQARFALTAMLATESTFDLAAGDSQRISLYVPAIKRGWQAMGTLTVASCFPLGIFRAWSPLRFDQQVLVYPKPSELNLPFPLSVDGDSTHGRNPSKTHGNDDFNGIRNYQHGDSPRKIHWKAYAKGQGLFSKHYAADTGDSELWLSLAQAPAVQIEEKISQLCRWIIDAEKAGLRYGLRLPHRTLEVASGANHQHECLAALALL